MNVFTTESQDYKEVCEIKTKYYTQIWAGSWKGPIRRDYLDLFIISDKSARRNLPDKYNYLFYLEDNVNTIHGVNNLVDLADNFDFLLGAANNDEDLPFSIALPFDSLDAERVYKNYTPKRLEDEINIYQAFLLDKYDGNDKCDRNDEEIKIATKILLENDIEFISNMIMCYQTDKANGVKNKFTKFMRRLLFAHLSLLNHLTPINFLDDNDNNDDNEYNDNNDGNEYNDDNYSATRQENNRISLPRVLCKIVFDYITDSYNVLAILNDNQI